MERRFALPEIAAKWLPLAWECEVSSSWHLWQLARSVLVGRHGLRSRSLPTLSPGRIRDIAECLSSEYEDLATLVRDSEEELRRLPDPRGQDFELDALLRDLDDIHRRQLETASSRLGAFSDSVRRAASAANEEVRRVIDESVEEASGHVDHPESVEEIGRRGAARVLKVLDEWMKLEEASWLGRGKIARASEPYFAEGTGEVAAVVSSLSAFSAGNDDVECYVGQMILSGAARLCLAGLGHVKALVEVSCELLDDVAAVQMSFQGSEVSERY